MVSYRSLVNRIDISRITNLIVYACKCFEGSVELAAVGVAIAIFNLVSKLLNVPVLNLTTSYVAEESIDSANIDERTSDTFREQDSSISGKGNFDSTCTFLRSYVDLQVTGSFWRDEASCIYFLGAATSS